MIEINPVQLQQQIRRIAIPMTVSNMLIPLMGLVDSFYIGHYDTVAAFAGVGIATLIMNVSMWLCGFLRMGTTAITAQSLGAGDGAKIKSTLVQSIVVSLILSCVMQLFLAITIPWILSLFQASQEAIAASLSYIFIVLWGLPALLVNLCLMGWLLGNSRGKAPLCMLAVMLLVNASLDWLLVARLGLGVQGVAWATVIAQYCGTLVGGLIAMNVWHKLSDVVCHIGQAVQRWGDYQAMLALNRDLFFRSLLLQAVFASFSIVGATMGDVVLATNQLLLNFMALAAYGLDGMANAAEVLSGEAVGKQSNRLIKVSEQLVIKWSLYVGIAYALIYGLFWDDIAMLMTNKEVVIELSKVYVYWLIALPVLASVAFAYDGLLIGAGLGVILRNGMILSVLVYAMVVGLSFSMLGNHGLWLALCVFMLFRSIIYKIFWSKQTSTGRLAYETAT